MTNNNLNKYLIKASELKTCDNLRRPTGILPLDISIGGGIPAGRISIISGKAGIGKDFLSYKIIAELQKNYGKKSRILISSFGDIIDDKLLKLSGASKDIGEFLILDYPTDSKSPTEELLNLITEAVASKKFQLIIINELGSEFTSDQGIATRAKLLDHFLSKYLITMRQTSIDEPNTTSLLFLSQIRVKLSGYMSHYESVGGEHLRHAKSLEIFLYDGSYIGSPPKGKSITFKIVKGKHGCHDGISGKYNFFYDKGVDKALTAFEYLVDEGLITIENKKIAFLLTKQEFKNKNDCLNYINENYEKIFTEMLKRNGFEDVRFT
jgi:archaellum biogenesis ATPase FlaH